MEHNVVKSKVTMYDCSFGILRIILWNIFWQPIDQVVHLLDRLSLSGFVLSCPSFDLPFIIVSTLPKSPKIDFLRIKLMKSSQDWDKLRVSLRSFVRAKSWKINVCKYSSFNKLHYIKLCADNAFVSAEVDWPWDWESFIEKSLLNSKLSIDCMSTSQKFTWWLFSKNKFQITLWNHVSWVWLPVIELFHL